MTCRVFYLSNDAVSPRRIIEGLGPGRLKDGLVCEGHVAKTWVEIDLCRCICLDLGWGRRIDKTKRLDRKACSDRQTPLARHA